MSKLITMKYADHLSRKEFKVFTAKLLKTLGYKNMEILSSKKPFSDILATNNFGERIDIKCAHLKPKEYAGFDTVAGAYTGMKYYNTKNCIALTNRKENKEAITTSNKLNIKYWGRDTLEALIHVANSIISQNTSLNNY